MARRTRDDRPTTDWDSERTLAAAEEEQAGAFDDAADTRCVCGGDEFLLEAYLHVVAGRARPEPVEVDRLTCPQCNREFEAITTEDGRFLRGEFLGYADADTD
jgi:hypothetical protein